MASVNTSFTTGGGGGGGNSKTGPNLSPQHLYLVHLGGWNF